MLMSFAFKNPYRFFMQQWLCKAMFIQSNCYANNRHNEYHMSNGTKNGAFRIKNWPNLSFMTFRLIYFRESRRKTPESIRPFESRSRWLCSTFFRTKLFFKE